jgi:hypothetical protein
MSITGTYRHYVRTGGRSRAPYSEKHITNASIYGYRPVVPASVLREREERQAADNRSTVERWLGDPVPERSGLGQYRRREQEREARERIRPSISAAPKSKSEVNAISAHAAAEVRAIARKIPPPRRPLPDRAQAHAAQVAEATARLNDQTLTPMQRKAYRLLSEGWSWVEVAFELAVPPRQLERESREADPARRKAAQRLSATKTLPRYRTAAGGKTTLDPVQKGMRRRRSDHAVD